MNREDQKNHKACEDTQRGEATRRTEAGEELFKTGREEGSPGEEKLMEEVCEASNLLKALQMVKNNKGSAGEDKMMVEELPLYVQKHWEEIRRQLLEGSYQPKELRKVDIPKPNGGIRQLGIPTVKDRFVQQAILQVLQRNLDGSFSENSFGFRPGRRAHEAIRRLQEYIAEGYEYVVDIDIEKFFDQVNHDVLMSEVYKRVKDKRVLKIIRRFLKSGIVMENGVVNSREKGTPQGGPLSPLLPNIYFDRLDKELERRGLHFVRYVDDCNIYVRSQRAAERVMRSISEYIAVRLKLKVNVAKSAVGRYYERKFLVTKPSNPDIFWQDIFFSRRQNDQSNFAILGSGLSRLGFSFMKYKGQIKRRISKEALEKFKGNVKRMIRRTAGQSLGRMIEGLNLYLKGWGGYFGICQTPTVPERLNGWIRRRLRSVMWKQWKRGKRRYQELVRLGVSGKSAAEVAGSSLGPWRMSKTRAIHTALSDGYFDKQGPYTLTIQSLTY